MGGGYTPLRHIHAQLKMIVPTTCLHLGFSQILRCLTLTGGYAKLKQIHYEYMLKKEDARPYHLLGAHFVKAVVPLIPHGKVKKMGSEN